MQQGNLPLAKEKLERAEKQDPKNIEAHTSLAVLYERLGRNEDAERQYQAALRYAPDSAEVANNYAVFLCRTGKVEPAIKLFETAAKDQLYRTPWAAHTNAGVCLRSNKRSADAVPYFERALAMRPDYADAVRELGDLQLELGHPEISLNVVDRYLAIGRASRRMCCWSACARRWPAVTASSPTITRGACAVTSPIPHPPAHWRSCCPHRASRLRSDERPAPPQPAPAPAKAK